MMRVGCWDAVGMLERERWLCSHVYWDSADAHDASTCISIARIDDSSSLHRLIVVSVCCCCWLAGCTQYR